jgi:hypothetical protein
MKNPSNAALQGFPRTILTAEEDGLNGYLVRFRGLGPLRARIADRAALLAGLGIAGSLLGTLMVQAQPAHPGWWAASIAAPLLGAPYTSAYVRRALSSAVAVHLRPDAILVLKGRTVTRRIERSLEHRFALIENDDAEIEKEGRDHAARRGRKPGVFAPLYHHHAPHLVLEVMGNRVDIATIFGRAEANRVLGRLAACDQLMANQSEVGRRLELLPADEQKPRPGGLPEDEIEDAKGA